MAGHWKKSRGMELTNRGIETRITQSWLTETESYRISRREKVLGGEWVKTHDRILDEPEATASFRALCIDAVNRDFDHVGGTGRVLDLTDAEAV